MVGSFITERPSLAATFSTLLSSSLLASSLIFGASSLITFIAGCLLKTPWLFLDRVLDPTLSFEPPIAEQDKVLLKHRRLGLERPVVVGDGGLGVIVDKVSPQVWIEFTAEYDILKLLSI